MDKSENKVPGFFRAWGIFIMASGILFLVGLPYISAAQSAKDAIKIGHIQPLSGPMSAFGDGCVKAAKLAAKEVNDSGGVLGRKIEILAKDTEARPEVGARVAQELFLKDGIHFLTGVSSTGVAQALAAMAKDQKRLFFCSNAQGPEITGKYCNRYTFRIGEDVIMVNRAGARVAAKQIPNIKRIASICPDYVYGHETWDCFRNNILKLVPGAKVVYEAWPKFMASDFKPYIIKLIEEKPDIVYSSLWSGDMITFIKQAKGFNFFDKTIIVHGGGISIDVCQGLKDEMVGMWGTDRSYYDFPKVEANKKFVEGYRALYNAYPSCGTAEAYACITGLALAIKKAGSTNVEAVIKSLEGLQWDAPDGVKVMRAGDHQTIEQYIFWGKIGPVKGLPFFGFTELHPVSGQEVIDSPTERGCQMK